jgi:hypothetical protein
MVLAERGLVQGGVRARLEEQDDLPRPRLAVVDQVGNPRGECLRLGRPPALARLPEPRLVGEEDGRGGAIGGSPCAASATSGV